MKLYLVVTHDKSSGALVTFQDGPEVQAITVHPLIYPEDALYSFSYHFPHIKFSALPDALQHSGYLPFSNGDKNFWYHLNSCPCAIQ